MFAEQARGDELHGHATDPKLTKRIHLLIKEASRDVQKFWSKKDLLRLPQFQGQSSRRHKHDNINFCLAILKGHWSGITNGGMEAFPVAITLYPDPKIL